MNGCMVHESGLILGSAGCSDDLHAHQVTLQETDDAWIGYGSQGAFVSTQSAIFPKSQWHCVLRPGDPIMSIHIPAGICFTPDRLDAAIANARAVAQRSYPEHHTCGFYCHSWLLDPALHNILGADSNIAQFGARFVRHPVRSSGKEVFGYVFPPNCSSYRDLPEATQLQRELKKRYLDGGFIRAYAGAFL